MELKRPFHLLSLHSLCPGQTASLQGVKNNRPRVHSPANHPAPICCTSQGSFSLNSGCVGQQLEDIWILPSRSTIQVLSQSLFDQSNSIYSLTSFPGAKSRKCPSDTAPCSAECPLTWIGVLSLGNPGVSSALSVMS